MILAVSGGINSIARFLSLLFVFLFVCVITWFSTKYIGKLQQGNMPEGNIELIEGFKISPGKYVQIVRIGNQYLALAICKDTVTVLTELSKDEIVIAEKKDMVSFKELLEKAKKRADKND